MEMEECKEVYSQQIHFQWWIKIQILTIKVQKQRKLRVFLNKVEMKMMSTQKGTSLEMMKMRKAMTRSVMASETTKTRHSMTRFMKILCLERAQALASKIQEEQLKTKIVHLQIIENSREKRSELMKL
jgi:hypothetical protein